MYYRQRYGCYFIARGCIQPPRYKTFTLAVIMCYRSLGLISCEVNVSILILEPEALYYETKQ